MIAGACVTETARNIPGTSPTPHTSAAATSAVPATTPPVASRTPSAGPATAAPATAAPAGSSAASLPPLPSSPPLPTGAAAIANGTASFSLAPAETKMFEPGDLAASRGATAPPCAELVWTVAWHATEGLSAAWYHQSAVVDLGRGRWGTADLGCAGFELRNDSSVTVSGELVFVIGSR